MYQRYRGTLGDCPVGVVMDITKNLTNKTSEKVTMQLDLKASTSGKETLSDHYGILRTLGKGNFAEVKLAYHLQTEEQVAIKVLQNGTNDDFSIQTELDILKTLDHPYIIKLFHIINTKEYTYMVLEHAAGGDLVSHIERVGSLQEEQAQHIFAQLVCAVHYCHENDIAHRDIKLDNMLLDDKGNIKLCDFGLATRVTPGQGTKGFCGTLEYCAPELFSDEEYDAMAADIWSMGVVLYAMVTSSFPFEGNTYSDMKEEMQDPKYHLPYKLSKNIANIIVQLFTVKPEQRPKIDDIRRHQWVKAKEEIWKITPSLEALCNNPNPSVVVDMCSMGYHPKDISACLHEKKFNNIMATYLILNHNSPRGHSKYTEKFLRASVAKSPADALTSIPSRRRLSELALPTLLEEHRVHDEKGSRKTTMRSLSMPATLCCQQKGNKRPPPAPKLARRKITYVKSRCLAVDSMICSWSSPRSLSSESISSAKCLSCEAPQDVNTPQNSSYTQSSGSYREIPCIVNTTATYDIQNSFEDAPPEGIPEIPTSSLQESSKNTFDDVPPEGIPEIQTSALQASSKNTFDDVPPEGIPEIQTSSHQASSKNIFEDVTPEDTTKIQRSYIQEISKNSFEDVTPEVITAASASRLSRGWKRVKKRTGNCLRRLCCCIPAGKRSHVSQKEAEPVEVESCAVAHMQLHGASKMHSCVS